MNYSVDLNILLYSIDTESPHYEKAAAFFPACLGGDATCYLTWDVLYSFVRISTHASIFKFPLTPQAAVSNVASLLAHPRVTALSPSSDSWAIFQRLSGEFPLRGNLVSDAMAASVLEANGVRKIYTHDRDLWKFSFLKPVDPLSGP